MFTWSLALPCCISKDWKQASRSVPIPSPQAWLCLHCLLASQAALVESLPGEAEPQGNSPGYCLDTKRILSHSFGDLTQGWHLCLHCTWSAFNKYLLSEFLNLLSEAEAASVRPP